jgi:hypothetical protein
MVGVTFCLNVEFAWSCTNDANGFEIDWTEGIGGSHWQFFDQSAAPVEVGDPGYPLPHTLFITPGAHPVTDLATIHYSDQNVPCVLSGKENSNVWECTAAFQCPQKVTNSDDFTPSTCEVTASQENQTATLTSPPMIVPPPTPDNVYTISAAVVDGNGEQADQTLNGSYTVAADKTPLVLQGKLPKSLTITPEITSDYAQFTYGDFSWRSDTKEAARVVTLQFGRLIRSSQGFL